jgi:hypothetical protein
MLSNDVPTAALRRAIQARDVEAFLAICSDDVALHSPISHRAAFQGHGAMRGPLIALFATLEDIEYSADVGEGTTRPVRDSERQRPADRRGLPGRTRRSAEGA